MHMNKQNTYLHYVDSHFSDLCHIDPNFCMLLDP
jgi:hypothetical protein